MAVKVKKNIRWYMTFTPVMACEKLQLEEKVLLNAIMSMKNSFDNVYATDEKVQEMTGLNSLQYDSALKGLTEKGLIVRRGKEWRIYCKEINKYLGVEVYSIDTLL